MITTFKIYYSVSNNSSKENPGRVIMNDNLIRFKDISEKYSENDIRRLCRNIGHYGKYSIIWDENTGIGVERE